MFSKNKDWKEYICKCNNCGTFLFDENPQTDTEKQTPPAETQDMLQMEDDNGVFWACPICKTDSFLTDNF